MLPPCRNRGVTTMRRSILTTFAAALLSILACPPRASAQGVATGGGSVALANLAFDERTSGGTLNACELVYTIVYEDNIYRRGDPVVLRGAFNMFDAGEGKGMGLGFKITMFDVVADKPKLAPINYAFISAKGQSYAGKEITTGDAEDGGLLVVYDIVNIPSLYAALLSGNIELNFNRRTGGSDVSVPVNLFEKRSDTALNFIRCSNKLTEGVMRRLQ
jgi:hypothetical protein